MMVNIVRSSIVAFVFALVLFPQTLIAQSLSLSVTPTLFQMSATQGQEWKSSVSVINSNAFPITVYAQPVNFQPQGEGGTGKFLPVFTEMTEGATLAEWIDITSEPIEIPPERSQNVTFTVTVPDDAAPGGHFAAIMVSTKPPEAEGSVVKTMQAVTSLFFVRLEGDVREEGRIREFNTERSLAQSPEMDFIVRFENLGNVHLQPQGDITIYNMWGQKRGYIPINQETNFGNVLPESIRKFNFSWKGEQSFTEIGRYRAELTLGYGEEGKKFVTSKINFYVVPLKEVGMTLGSILAFLLFVSWAVRAYIKRMLRIAGIEPNTAYYRSVRSKGVREMEVVDEHTVRIGSFKAAAGPVREGVSDLRSRMTGRRFGIGWLQALWSFVVSYRLFFGSLLLLVGAGVVVWWYVMSATVGERAYEVTINNPDTDVTLTSEEIKYEEMRPEAESVSTTRMFDAASTTPVSIINISGQPGLGAAMAARLESEAYVIDSITTEFGRERDRSVIVTTPGTQEAALALSKLLGGVLVSAVASSSDMYSLTLYTGFDLVSESE